jgi:hypothetical protein
MPGIPTAGSPAAQVTTAPGNSSPINLSKGIMATFGHSYVGRPAMKVLNADTADEWNDYTKVKLDPYKLKDPGTQQYPVSDREAAEEEEAVELKPPKAKFVLDQSFGLWVELDDISIPGDGLLDSSNNVWDVGEDCSNCIGAAPLQHTFTNPGEHSVSLTVTDTNGLSHTYGETIDVEDFESPIASFTTTINDNFVFFNNASTPGDGTIMSWNWDFDDGGTSENPYPTHEFVAGQTYSVSLTVTDQHDKTGTYTEDIIIEGEE